MDRISPDEDAGGGGSGQTGVYLVAIVAGVVMIFSLLTLVDALSSQRIIIGIAAAGGVFLGFVAMFWVFQRLQRNV